MVALYNIAGNIFKCHSLKFWFRSNGVMFNSKPMMKSIFSQITLILTVCFVVSGHRMFANDADTTARVKPDPLPSWTLIVPGAVYFHQGEIAQGLTFTVLQA